MMASPPPGNAPLHSDREGKKAQKLIQDIAVGVKGQANSNGMVPLAPEYTPGEFDVICARGKQAKNHSGNVRYRRIIVEKMKIYDEAPTKLEKTVIVSEILDSVRTVSPNGGFIKKFDGRWFEVGDHIAREKIGQSLRDMLHTKYSSSTQAKKIRRHRRQASPFAQIDHEEPKKKSATSVDSFEPLQTLATASFEAMLSQHPAPSAAASVPGNFEGMGVAGRPQAPYPPPWDMTDPAIHQPLPHGAESGKIEQSSNMFEDHLRKTFMDELLDIDELSGSGSSHSSYYSDQTKSSTPV